MHHHVWGSYCAKFDDDDCNHFQGIACEGHTHRHIQTDWGGGRSTLKFAVAYNLQLGKQKDEDEVEGKKEEEEHAQQ